MRGKGIYLSSSQEKVDRLIIGSNILLYLSMISKGTKLFSTAQLDDIFS
jgi:hypothetical protein